MEFFFFKAPATAEITTLSLHDALPICPAGLLPGGFDPPLQLLGAHLVAQGAQVPGDATQLGDHRVGDEVRVDLVDRKSTRLNSSHANISYAVFCLKNKNYPCDDTCRHT